MTIKLTPASFLSGVRQSGLIDPQRIDQLVVEMEQAGVDQNSATALAASLVQRGALSEWQSEKLLQGRHKGFILGRYRLLSLLGAGEMSAVYLAEHVLLERRCAIKVLPGNKVKDTSYLGRFHREAKAVARLDHVNIVRAYDVDQQYDSGTEIHFLVMEYVLGKNLTKLLAEKGPLDFVTATEIVRQAADGLSHAHQAGMVHRDIKPENLLIDANGVVKILDLGLARFFQSTEEESLTIKHDEKVLGTADYLAPEQAIDSHKVDARADIYSLGCTFYFALTGHPPFTEGTLVQRLFAHQTKSPNPVRNERPDMPEELVTILEKMMAKKTSDRFQTAADLALTLTRWLVDHGGRAWRNAHVVQVAQIKGMDGFEAPLPIPIASPTSTPQVHLMPAANKSLRSATRGGRPVDLPAPKVEFYSTTRLPESGQNQAETARPAGHSSSRNRIERSTVSSNDSGATSGRERENQELRRKKLNPRVKVDDAASREDQLTNGPATAVASRSRLGSPSSALPKTHRMPVTETVEETESNQGALTWLNSKDPAHVQTRRMVTWITAAALAMMGFSIIVYWVFSGIRTPENQVTQPRQDSVIDALPRSPTV